MPKASALLLGLLLLSACGGGEPELEPGESVAEDSHVEMARVLLREGQVDAALAQLGQSNQPAGGERAPAWLPYVIEQLLGRREFAKADSLLELHIDEVETNEDLALAAAVLAESSGDLERAVTIYETVAAESPNRIRARNKMAMIAFMQGRNADAIEYADDALSLDRFHKRARTVKSQALLAEGRADEAYLEIMKTPANPARFLIEAEALLAAGRADDAVTALAPLMQMQTEAPAPLYLMGRAQLAAGNLAAAEARLRPLAEQQRPYEESQLHLASVFRRSGRVAQADSLLEAYSVHRVWRQAQALRTEGISHSREGDLEGALEYFERAAAKLPNDEDLANDVGAVLARMERFDEAEAKFLAAVEHNPENRAAHRNLANLYNILGREEDRDKHSRIFVSLAAKAEKETKQP
jgi:Flp pilus assembly protein TadD